MTTCYERACVSMKKVRAFLEKEVVNLGELVRKNRAKASLDKILNVLRLRQCFFSFLIRYHLPASSSPLSFRWIINYFSRLPSVT